MAELGGDPQAPPAAVGAQFARLCRDERGDQGVGVVGGGVEERGEDLLGADLASGHDGVEQSGAGAEVVLNGGGVGLAGAGDDVPQLGAVDALRGEDLLGRADQLLPGLGS